jgi:hypothetical protein
MPAAATDFRFTLPESLGRRRQPKGLNGGFAAWRHLSLSRRQAVLPAPFRSLLVRGGGERP